MPMQKSNIFQRFASKIFNNNGNPGGNVLAQTTSTLNPTEVVNQDIVTQKEPYGTIDPKMIKGRASGWSQVQNLSNSLDVAKVQAALRAAERGDCTLLFAYYRDLFISTGIVTSEISKRKLAVLADKWSILPVDKSNKDDVFAAEVIKDMIQNCPTWLPSLVHLMNAILYPVAVGEKIFRTIEPWEYNPHNLKFYLKEIHPVDYVLINYRLPYLPQGPINPGGSYAVPSAPNLNQPWFYQGNRPEDTIYDVDSWEPDLRFWHVFNNGLIDYSWSNIYAPDKDRHIVYRCNLLNGIARDNFGGLGRAILFWAIMSQLGREYFLQLLDKYGLPFITVHADTSQKDTMDMLENALGMASKLHALVVNKDAVVDIKEISIAGAADGHEKFLNFCNDQISLLISGQTLGSRAQSTGLGSGVASLQNNVRKDIIAYDRECLSTCLRTQLFQQFLRINNISGRPPLIVWGENDNADLQQLSATISNLKRAGIEPTDDAIQNLSEKFGFALQRGKQPENPFIKDNIDNTNIDEEQEDEPIDENIDIPKKSDKVKDGDEKRDISNNKSSE